MIGQSVATPFRDRLDTWILRFMPSRSQRPRESFQLRLLIGGALLGAVVAVPSAIVSIVDGTRGPTLVITTFGVGCIGLLAATRAGFALTALQKLALALVGGFLVLECLQTAVLDWGALKWLVLLPLLSLFMSDATESDRGTPALGRQVYALWIGNAWAVGLACFIAFANRMAWTGGQQDMAARADAPPIGRLIDFALFAFSIAGLLSIYAHELQKTEAELAELRSMLSMCAWCRRIRDDEEGWIVVERYMKKHTSTQLTHGICPDCSRKVESEMQ